MGGKLSARWGWLVELCVLVAAIVGSIVNPVILYRLDQLEQSVAVLTAVNHDVALLCEAHPELRCVATLARNP